MNYLRLIIPRIAKDESRDTLNKLKLKGDKDVLDYLIQSGYRKNDIIRELEKYYGIKYIDISNIDITNEVLGGFDLDYLEKNVVLPYEIDKTNKICNVVIGDTTNQELIRDMQSVCSRLGYNAIFNFSFQFEIIDKIKDIKSIAVVSDIDEVFDTQSWVNDVLNKGIKLKASDIHIERIEDSIQVRYRVDGILVNRKKFKYSESNLSSIVVRLKIISDMDITEKRRPQDGRIDNYKYGTKTYDMRVSSVGTIYGEKIVIKIIEKDDAILGFRQLGYSKENEIKIRKMLKNKNGIVYIGGATGSGKTTSLYSMIDILNTEDKNIYTIEDPVEKTIQNINQIQINKLAGVDYANTLRSLLRQDPDVIVVGEVRDLETAELSSRASLTGHLVLCTVHANNAIDCISRLIDIGVAPYIMSAGTLGFLSQRLVRVLCDKCKQRVTKLEPHEKAWIDEVNKKYDKGVNGNRDYADGEFYRAVGCKECHGGYKGRVALVEILEATENIKHAISRSLGIDEIMKIALDEGFRTLELDGLDKASKGMTTIDELIIQVS